MNVGSLFSGIGGFDLGLERAGHRIVFQCEKDEYRRRVLARHWPGVPCFEDVRNIRDADSRAPHARDIEAVGNGDRGAGSADVHAGWDESSRRVDLLCGGFPCQDLSVAGRRAGLQGERSGLFFEFARIADALLSDGGWVLIENVPGLLSSHGGRDFAVLLSTLAELGFHDLAWRVLDSRYLGVPQRRRRVFILARRSRGRCASEVLLEPESGGGDFETGREARQGVAGSVADGAQSARSLTASERWDGETEDLVAKSLHGSGASIKGEDHQTYVAGTVRSHARPGSNEVGSIVAHTLRSEGFDASEDGTGRGTPLTVAGALGGGNDGAGRRSEFDPNLICTPADAQRMRGTSGISSGMDCAFDPKPDGPRYAACGDAVTVQASYWIGKRLMEANRQAVTQ